MSAQRERLYFLMQRTAHALKTRADAWLMEAASLSAAQAAVLAVLESRGSMSQKDLARHLALGETAMTGMVARLLAHGYVRRRRSPEDRRAWVLEASSKGLAALDAARDPFARINAVLDGAFPGSNARQLAAGLRLVLKELE